MSPTKLRGHVDPALRIETDPAVRTLALRAIDAAKSAGATYADVRLTRTLQQTSNGGSKLAQIDGAHGDSEFYGVGVRALFGGAWGFAASPYWTPDEVVQLAHDAVEQARMNATGDAPPIDLGRIPVASGSWSTPVRVDPFTIPIEEREELLGAWVELAKQAYRGARNYESFIGMVKGPLGGGANFMRQERAIATSDGAYFTQTLYETSLGFEVVLVNTVTGREVRATAKNGGYMSAGWELFLDARLPEQLPELVADVQALMRREPVKPGDVGRYDVVFDAVSMASIVNATIGVPTQLDRALGYESNASGTSYLSDPLAMLGTYQVGAPQMTVTANRSLPRGLATVKWDDEGVEPPEFTLVEHGVLADYQTTRAQADLLAPYYAKHGKLPASHGCARADSALSITMQHAPNMQMEPGMTRVSFDDLIKDTPRGIAVMGGGVNVDFQGRNGEGRGAMREIVNGRLGREIGGLAFSFATTELLKNITAIGGTDSLEHVALSGSKGQPRQSVSHTVSAVPAKVKSVTFIDPLRKA